MTSMSSIQQNKTMASAEAPARQQVAAQQRRQQNQAHGDDEREAGNHVTENHREAVAEHEPQRERWLRTVTCLTSTPLTAASSQVRAGSSTLARRAK